MQFEQTFPLWMKGDGTTLATSMDILHSLSQLGMDSGGV